MLDAELAGLPDIYRQVIVLCDLQGRTIRDAAGELGWPVGTAATRLTRGRARLAQRLLARGLGPTTAAVAAGIPAALLTSTMRAAAAFAAGSTCVCPAAAQLAEGVLRAMLIKKLTVVAALVVAVGVVVGGVGRFALPARAENPTPAPIVQKDTPKADPAPVPPATLLEAGVWYPYRIDREGRTMDVCDTPPHGLLWGPDPGPIRESVFHHDPIGPVVVRGLSVAKDAAVTIDGKAGQLDKLSGARLRLRFGGDSLTVTAIDAKSPPPVFWPVVKSVDAAKRTVTVQLADRGAATELAVAADAVITDRLGRKLALADLPPGTKTGLVLGVDDGRPVVKSLRTWKD